MIETNKVYCMDAFELLKQLPDKSVDLVLIDPPYFQVMKSDWKGRKYEWDNQWETIKDYQEWILKLGQELKRILKSTGSFYIFADDKVCAYVQVVLDEIFELQNLITWVKPNNLTIKGWTQYKSFSPITEKILFYCSEFNKTGLQKIYNNKDCFPEIKEYLRNEKQKSKFTNKKLNLMFSEYYKKDGCVDRSVIEHYFQNVQWVFPTQEIYENILQKTGFFQKPYFELKAIFEENIKQYEELRLKYESERRYFNPEKNFTDVWTFNIMGGSESVNHPTQKPLKIIERIIKTSSQEGDIILDCFVGSGTTAVACKKLNRNFICCDNNTDYVAITNKRLAQKSVTDFTSATPTLAKPKEFNMGLEVPTSSPPKLSPTEITSPNPNIKLNSYKDPKENSNGN